MEKEAKIYGKFLFAVILTVVLSMTAAFLGMSVRTNQMLHEQLLSRARTDFNNILITRSWNARFGGVYVEKKNGVRTNPFLIDPEIRTVDGRVFTKINPAVMTREISDIYKRKGDFWFRITSLKPLNPANQPDRFERNALLNFERGETEHYEEETSLGRHYFRYMAPLITEASCLACHARQGYKQGDIRGGISVNYDIETFRRKVRLNTLLIALFALATTTPTLAMVWFYTKRLIRRLADAHERLQQMAITDELTGVFNRRQVVERLEEEVERSLRLRKQSACLLLDIDHFKRINDTYGHQTGDEVLKRVAHLIHESLRPYDTLGRFGGEEFLIVLPETEAADAGAIAERMRELIKDAAFLGDDLSAISVTVSIGLSRLEAEDESVNSMIKRADENLYRAKEAGRDRVCCA